MNDTSRSTGHEVVHASVVEAVQAYVAMHAETLRTRGFASLALFGSFARGEGGPESDLDVLYEFAPGRASLDAVLDLQAALEEATGRAVHVVSRQHVHPILRKRVLSEAAHLFSAPLS